MTEPLENLAQKHGSDLTIEERERVSPYVQRLTASDYDDLNIEERHDAICHAINYANEDIAPPDVCDGETIGEFADDAGFTADDPRRHAYLLAFIHTLTAISFEDVNHDDNYLVRFDADGGDEVIVWVAEAASVNDERDKAIARYFIPAPKHGRKASKERLIKFDSNDGSPQLVSSS